tara:strand:- start:217 stop:564 length:348 start_codon:yes stop_codon:yes gene_type:complete
MRRALKYCARTFFQRDDNDLADVVRCEQEEMQNESTSDDAESTDEEEATDDDVESTDDTEEEGDGENEETYTGVPEPSDVQLARNVDTVVQHWDTWYPEDPVHALIKRAIDNTPV